MRPFLWLTLGAVLGLASAAVPVLGLLPSQTADPDRPSSPLHSDGDSFIEVVGKTRPEVPGAGCWPRACRSHGRKAVSPSTTTATRTSTSRPGGVSAT